MNNQEILTKALEKAVDNGWAHEHLEDNRKEVQGNGGIWGRVQFWDAGLGEWGGYYTPHPYSIIFDHDFAKALWGEEDIDLATVEPSLGKNLKAIGATRLALALTGNGHSR
jgi:hypothetical protein